LACLQIHSMKVECFNCQQPVTETAKFCGPCGTNIRCTDKECGQELYAEEAYCRECGKEVIVRRPSASTTTATSGVPINTIRFRQDKSSTDLEINVTDVVGSSGVEILAAVLNGTANRFLPGNRRKPLDITPPIPLNQTNLFNGEESEAEPDQKELPPASTAPPIVSTTPAPTDAITINDVFEASETGWFLQYTQLKGGDKQKDYIGRVVVLFLYYRHELGTSAVLKSDVNALVKDCSLNASNYSKWLLSDGKAFIASTGKTLTLNRAGIEKAKEILAEMADDNVPPGFKIGKRRKSPRTKKKAGEAETETEIEVEV
jgi:hypothetical protein